MEKYNNILPWKAIDTSSNATTGIPDLLMSQTTDWKPPKCVWKIPTVMSFFDQIWSAQMQRPFHTHYTPNALTVHIKKNSLHNLIVVLIAYSCHIQLQHWLTAGMKKYLIIS